MNINNGPEGVVRQFLALWSSADAEGMAELFASDGVYDNVPMKRPLVGRQALLQWLNAVLNHISRIDVEILNISTNGEWVLCERLDDHVKGDTHMRLPVMNATRVVDGKIVMFRDYFCRQTCAEVGLVE